MCVCVNYLTYSIRGKCIMIMVIHKRFDIIIIKFLYYFQRIYYYYSILPFTFIQDTHYGLNHCSPSISLIF